MGILRSLFAVVLITEVTLSQNIRNKNVHCEEYNYYRPMQYIYPHYGYYPEKMGYECVIRNYLLDNDREYYLDKGEDITKLKITQSTMESLPSSLFSNIYNLQTLEIIKSKLEHVNQLKLPELTSVHLSSNEIKSIDQKAFIECPKLSYINLNNNNISALNGTPFSSLNSLDIDLSHNKIRNISDSVFNYNVIHKLNFSYNSLEELDFSIFKNINSLKWLDLSFNNLRILHSSDNFLSRNISLNVTFNELTSLNLSNIQLLYLDASDNKIENLAIGPGCREMNVEYNRISEITIHEMSPLLKTLNMRYNKMDNNLGDICKCENLEILWLDSNNIDDIGSCFSKMRNLKELNLAKNNILQFNHLSFYAENQIKTLDLSFNQLEVVDEFTMSIFTQLEFLYLNGNKIYDFNPSPRTFLPNLLIVGLSHNRFKCSKLFWIIKKFKEQGLQLYIDPTRPVNTTNIDGNSCYLNHESELKKNSNNLDDILAEKTNEKITLFWQKITKMEEKLNSGISLIKKFMENTHESNSNKIIELENRLRNIEKEIHSKTTEEEITTDPVDLPEE